MVTVGQKASVGRNIQGKEHMDNNWMPLKF